MPSYADLVRNNRSGGGGGWRAQLRAKRQATGSVIETAGDPDWEARQYDTQAMVPSAYAEKRRNEVMESAREKFTKFGEAMSPGEREDILQIAETGAPRKGNFFMNLLNVIDTPAELLRLGVADLFGADTSFGTEIELEDYWNAATGKEATVRESLGDLAGDDGQFLLPGSNLVQAAGVQNKVAKGVLGFGADVLLDPLNAISFGAVGLGKKAIIEGAQAAAATAAKAAAKAIADDTVAGLVGLERRFADGMLTRADEASEAIYEQARRAIDKKNPDGLAWADDAELVSQLRETARKVAIETETTAARIGAGEDLTIPQLVRDAYLDAGLTHGAGDITDDITGLVANKKFGELEDRFRDFIDYGATEPWVTGGMKLVSPFFRKHFPAIDIGFRNDWSLRGKIDSVLDKLPGMAGQFGKDMISKFDVMYGATKGAMEGKAWSLRFAENLTRNLAKDLATGPAASGALRATLTDVHKVASAEGIAPELADSHLIRLMGSTDAGVEANAIEGISPTLATSLLESASTVRGVLISLREAAVESGLELGNIENYFPMLASKEFRSTVEQLANKSAKIVWDGVEEPELRMGLQILSELVASSAEAKKLSAIDQGSTRFASQRTVSRHVFQLLGTPIEMADLEHGMWPQFLGQVKEGYLTHAAINRAIKAALGNLADNGKLSKGVADITPYTEDVGEVLDTYVGSISQVINYRHYVRELKRIGLMKPASKRIHAGDTMAETLNHVGPAGRNMIEELVQLADRVAEFHGERGARTTSVTVAKGWTLDVPTVVLEDPRFQSSLRKLRRRYETVMRHASDAKARTAAKAKEFTAMGVHPQLAKQMAGAMTDVEMNAAIDEIRMIGEEQATFVLAGVHEMLATASDTIDDLAQEKVLRAARKQADAIRRGSRKTVKAMRGQWNKQFARDVTEEIPVGSMDMLALAPDGQPILRRLAGDVQPVLNAEREAARHAKVRGASEKARDLMADKFRTKGVKLGALIKDLPVETIESLWKLFRLKGHFTDVNSDVLSLPVADFVERLDLRSIWQIDPDHPAIDDALWHLWRASWKGSTKSKKIEWDLDVLDWHAASALSNLRKNLEISLGQEEMFKKADVVLQAMRSNDIESLTRKEQRQAVLWVLERFGINTDFVHFPAEGGMVWRPTIFEKFHDEVNFDSVIGKLRGIYGDTMSRAELLTTAKQIPDDALMNMDPEVRLFVDMLGPNGELPFDMDEYENLLDLVRDITIADTTLAQSQRVTADMLKGKATITTHLNKVVRELDRTRSGGTAVRLKKVWEDGFSDLRRLLPSEEFDRLNSYVEYMKGTARMGGPGRRIVERNIAETRNLFKPLDGAVGDFNAKVAEIEDELLIGVGQPFTDARDALRTFQQATLNMWRDFGPETGTTTATVFEPAFDEAFKKVEALGQQASKAVETIRAGSKGFGGPGMPEAVTLPKVFEEDMTARQAMQKVAEHLAELRPARVLTAETGNQSPAIAGLAGDILGGQVAPDYVNAILENMAKQIRAVSTPLGLRKIAEDTRAVTKWWKAAATVANPTFVPRNLIGGVVNGRIIGVGIANYAAAFGSVSKMRKLMERGGLTPAQALARMDASEREWLTALFDSELLFSTYASTLKNVRGRAPVSVKPWSEDFALFRAGGAVMQKSEDWMRAAAFHRHYDPKRPETMQMAKQLALEVHFDYSALTAMERKITSLVPFFVWTRRNLPLQMRVMLENPGFVNKYQHFITEADEFFDGEETVADDFPGVPYASGLTIDTDIIFGGDTPFWSRLMLSPDVPLKDLEDAFKAFLPGHGTAFNHVLGMLHPAFGTIAQAEASQDFPDTNAPFGLSRLLRFFADESNAGDVQLPYSLGRLAQTAVPFAQNYANLSGIRPSDPRAQARLGYQEGGEEGIGDSLRGAAVAASKFAGGSLQTPGDALGPVAESRDFLTELIRRMRLEGRIEPEQ